MTLIELLAKLDEQDWDTIAIRLRREHGYWISPNQARDLARAEITREYNGG